jgi:type II secretory pathway pseudopilin PulG
MNITLIILVVEVAVVLLGIVSFLFFLRWKGNKDKTAEFEKLLDNVDSHKEERKSQLAEYLINSYALETEKAKETSEFMVEAEKLFLQQFLKQQIEQTPVTDFYQNLCELLDQYLYFIPTVNSEKDSPNDEKRVEQNSDDIQNNEVTDSDETDSENTKATTASEETEADEAEPDWGDAFAESGDEIDEETKAGYETEVKKD